MSPNLISNSNAGVHTLSSKLELLLNEVTTRLYPLDFLEIPISSLKSFRLHFYFPDTNFETQYTQTRKRKSVCKLFSEPMKGAGTSTPQLQKEGTRFQIKAQVGQKQIKSNLKGSFKCKLLRTRTARCFLDEDQEFFSKSVYKEEKKQLNILAACSVGTKSQRV